MKEHGGSANMQNPGIGQRCFSAVLPCRSILLQAYGYDVGIDVHGTLGSAGVIWVGACYVRSGAI